MDMKMRMWLTSSLIVAILALGTVWAVDGQGSCPKKDAPCCKQDKDKPCDKQKSCDKQKQCDKAKTGCPKEGAGAPNK